MFYAAFSIGLLGSLHCLGMCGPIAFALPVRTTDKTIRFLKYLIYNSGRVMSYAALGLVIGVVGKGLELAGVQQIISVTTGVLILISVLIFQNTFKVSLLEKLLAPYKSALKRAFGSWIGKKGNYALFVMGVLNGLLPCGMVYMAMLGALSAGNALSGSIFMAAFGLGTVPLMMGVSLFSGTLGSWKRNIFQKAIPVAACLVAVLLIFRGLNAEIPFVKTASSCCHVSH